MLKNNNEGVNIFYNKFALLQMISIDSYENRKLSNVKAYLCSSLLNGIIKKFN